MKLYDISQEVFTCAVYPGDPAPRREVLSSMDSGALYNLTAFSMCAHNGTHIDAPAHFIQAGQTVDQLSLSKTVGYAYVTKHHGAVTADDARAILASAIKLHPDAAKRILIGGDALVTLEAAQVFADAKIDLLGNESQTVGPEDAPMAVHQVLLSAEVVLLGGVRLANVSEGIYLLFAAPLLLGDAEGAPCRAVLVQL
jgi:arylformamidase